jgi:flagellar basal body-associated protein FliL
MVQSIFRAFSARSKGESSFFSRKIFLIFLLIVFIISSLSITFLASWTIFESIFLLFSSPNLALFAGASLALFWEAVKTALCAQVGKDYFDPPADVEPGSRAAYADGWTVGLFAFFFLGAMFFHWYGADIRNYQKKQEISQRFTNKVDSLLMDSTATTTQAAPAPTTAPPANKYKPAEIASSHKIYKVAQAAEATAAAQATAAAAQAEAATAEAATAAGQTEFKKQLVEILENKTQTAQEETSNTAGKVAIILIALDFLVFLCSMGVEYFLSKRPDDDEANAEQADDPDALAQLDERILKNRFSEARRKAEKGDDIARQRMEKYESILLQKGCKIPQRKGVTI